MKMEEERVYSPIRTGSGMWITDQNLLKVYHEGREIIAKNRLDDEMKKKREMMSKYYNQPYVKERLKSKSHWIGFSWAGYVDDNHFMEFVSEKEYLEWLDES